MKNKNTFFIISMSYISLFGLGLTDNLKGSLFPEILNVFSMSSIQGACFFIITSLFSIFAGFSTHYLNLKFSVFSSWRVGVMSMSIGSLIIYLAKTLPQLFVGCAFLGIGFGILAVTQNLLITMNIEKRFVKKTLSGLHSMYGISSFLAPLLVSYFLTKHLPWNYLFLLSSIVVFLIFISSFFYRQKNYPDKLIINQNILSTGNEHKVQLNKTQQRLLACSISAYVAMELLISTRLTSYLTTFSKWPLKSASIYLTYFFLFLLTGRLFCSLFQFPLATKKILLLSLLSSIIFILFGLRINPFFLCLSGLFMAPFYPIAMAYMTEVFPLHISEVTSLTISLQSIFVILMNLILGILTDHFGIDIAMYSCFLFGGLSWTLLMQIEPSIVK